MSATIIKFIFNLLLLFFFFFFCLQQGNQVKILNYFYQVYISHNQMNPK